MGIDFNKSFDYRCSGWSPPKRLEYRFDVEENPSKFTFAAINWRRTEINSSPMPSACFYLLFINAKYLSSMRPEMNFSFRLSKVNYSWERVFLFPFDFLTIDLLLYFIYNLYCSWAVKKISTQFDVLDGLGGSHWDCWFNSRLKLEISVRYFFLLASLPAVKYSPRKLSRRYVSISSFEKGTALIRRRSEQSWCHVFLDLGVNQSIIKTPRRIV